MPKILIVDDDPAVRTSLELLLKRNDYQPVLADGPAQAISSMKSNRPDLILLDMNFSRDTSGREGLELLREIRSAMPAAPVILITAWGSIELAVQGMQVGAVDFINKPWNNEHLLRSVNTALQLAEKERSTSPTPVRRTLDRDFDFSKIIGSDPQLLHLLATVGRVSDTDASVLILGESGTGKELIAEALHQNSRRRNNAFVKVNLGGIPTNLFESEMFGHCKGAFTDAHHDRAGRFEKAQGGTIFLDEIGDLDRTSQVKLLRVLQDRTYEVLGSSTTRQVDVRVVSATNRDLKALVASGDFREDLFYRINLITLKIPALREHPNDIPILVRQFIDNLKQIYNRPNLTVDSRVLSWLKTLPWTGNIRELKNLVERSVLVTVGDCLGQADFLRLLEPVTGTDKIGLPAVGAMTLDELETSMIRKAMEFHDNNIQQVARSLGLSRAALYRRLEKYGLKTCD